MHHAEIRLYRKKKVEAVKDLREQVKGIVSGLKKDYFYQKPEEMAADMQICLPYMEELVGLVKCFSQRFDAKKRQENVIDFQIWSSLHFRSWQKKQKKGLNLLRLQRNIRISSGRL